MLRRYTVASFLEKVDMVRAGPFLMWRLSTDVIVAFPGESEDGVRGDAGPDAARALRRCLHLQDTVREKARRRPGLPTEEFIPDDIGQERLERLIEVSRGIQAEINRGEVGRVRRGAPGAAWEGGGHDVG